jgi:hypothetical protein
MASAAVWHRIVDAIERLQPKRGGWADVPMRLAGNAPALAASTGAHGSALRYDGG